MSDTKICVGCGEPFHRNGMAPSTFEQRKYCSRHCYEHSPRPQRRVVSYDAKVCDECGAKFERPANVRGASWDRRTLCSNACARARHERIAYETRPERKCPICGNKFRTRHPLKYATTCGDPTCKRRYKLEIQAPKIAATLRATYARGERPKVRGISPREELLWPLLRNHGWQWRHRWFDSHGCFELDFALFEQKLNVEIDGPEHNWPMHRNRDEQRDTELERRGWRILRIQNADVDDSPQRVARRITRWANSA